MKLPRIVVKDKRKALLAVVAGLGLLLVGYGTLRATTSFRLPPKLDRELPDFIIFAAFAAFLYGRDLAKKEEKKAKEDEERAAGKAGGEGAPDTGASETLPEAPGGAPGEADHRDD